MAQKKKTMPKMAAKPSSRLACLTINYANWKAYLITRAISVVFALISLLSLGMVAEWNRRMLPATRGWQWASWEIQWSFFIPGVFSWLWGVMAMSKVYFTMKPVPAAADLLVDLTVCVFDLLAFVYIFSVTGPMQWWISKASSKPTIVYAGVWETIGVVALILLFLTHILLFVWAWQSTFSKPLARARKSSHKQLRAMRRATPDEEALWFSASRESSMDPWFRKYMGPAEQNPVAASGEPEDKAKRKTKFDLPVCMSKSQLHLNRLGNSWDCGLVVRP